MTEQERFIQEMKNKFGDLVDLRICQNGDGGFMAWDAQVAFWAWQAAQQKEGYVLVPVEPTPVMLDAARDWSVSKYGKAVGNDGTSGCYKAMIAAAQEPT